MSDATLEELSALADAAVEHEEKCKDAFQEAQVARYGAMVKYNEALAKEKGIVLNETIVVSPERWSWSSNKTMNVVLIQGAQKLKGRCVGRQVTSKNAIWKGRRALTINLEDVTVTDQKLEVSE